MTHQQLPNARKPRDSLSVKVGGWFEANATGKGVIAIPIMIVVLAAAGLASTLLH